MIKKLWNEKPLALILFVGAFFRLMAVLFSKGYGMHDDHFLVIEAAKSWADGFDYNDWLPNRQIEHQVPSGHSFFYAGLHYFLFKFLKVVGLTDPQGIMYVVRLLHAVLSLSIIWCGYKITEKLTGMKQARMVGLLLSLFWFTPFLSVRNLIEYVCIAPLIYATWLVIKNRDSKKIIPYIWAGFWLGIAFSIRFQSIIFSGGFCLALLFSKKIKEAFITGIMFAIVGALIQGITDFYIWGAPFVEFKEYILYNIANSKQYFVAQWYMYFFLLIGILIPPISFALLFGYFKLWKRHLVLFLPSFIFLAFHCYFPNKQERFILPIVPFIIILGYIGWEEYYTKSAFWQKHQKLSKGFWVFFWIINTIPLCLTSVAYSKRNRVESMTYIAAKGDVTYVAIEDSNRDDFMMPPQFYMEKWGHVFFITSNFTAKNFAEEYQKSPVNYRPNYVVFFKEDNMAKRVNALKEYFPTLTYETTIEPSSLDKIMFWLNPMNSNQTSYIYKIK
jgi:hypothetical protein